MSFDERLSLIGAAAMMGRRATVYCIGRDLANKVRHGIRRLKIPAPARKLIKVKQWNMSMSTHSFDEHGILVE